MMHDKIPFAGFVCKVHFQPWTKTIWNQKVGQHHQPTVGFQSGPWIRQSYRQSESWITSTLIVVSNCMCNCMCSMHFLHLENYILKLQKYFCVKQKLLIRRKREVHLLLHLFEWTFAFNLLTILFRRIMCWALSLHVFHFIIFLHWF